MNVQIGGGALAVILTGMLIVFGVSECQRGPLTPEVADDASDAQQTWLTIEHRIKRYDPALTQVTRDQQALTVFYRPATPAEEADDWAPDMLRIVGHALAALNGAPGGKAYTQVTVSARMLVDDDVVLVYDMPGFEAIKTQQDGYFNFASLPRSLSFSPAALAQINDACRGMNAQAFYPQFCRRVKEAATSHP